MKLYAFEKKIDGRKFALAVDSENDLKEEPDCVGVIWGVSKNYVLPEGVEL